jgi:hypothetical protein
MEQVYEVRIYEETMSLLYEQQRPSMLLRPKREAADLCGVDRMKTPLAREIHSSSARYFAHTLALEKIADVVLNYRPKSKRPKPRKRKKAAKRA